MAKKKASVSRVPFLTRCAVGIALGLGLASWCMGPSDASIEAKVVKIVNGHGSCSGEQVRAPSGESYILTAAHCRPLADASGMFTIIDESGHTAARRLIAEDPVSDLLLIEGLPGVRGLDIADSSHPKQAVRTFTHGQGYDTYKTEGVLIQDEKIQVILGLVDAPEQCAMPKQKLIEVDLFGMVIRACILDVSETVTTAFIAPGSSGGAVLDARGRLVGVVSAGGQGYGYLVRLKDVQGFLKGY